MSKCDPFACNQFPQRQLVGSQTANVDRPQLRLGIWSNDDNSAVGRSSLKAFIGFTSKVSESERAERKSEPTIPQFVIPHAYLHLEENKKCFHLPFVVIRSGPVCKNGTHIAVARKREANFSISGAVTAMCIRRSLDFEARPVSTRGDFYSVLT